MLRPPLRLAAVAAVAGIAAGCRPSAGALGDAERAAIADSVRGLLASTYRFDSGAVVGRFMRLYPDSGRVVSAASGGFTTSRDTLLRSLTAFWEGAGQYMQRPRWSWGPMAIDVLDRNAVVVTARYTVPHWTPDSNPHVIGGAWTSIWTRRDGRWVIVQEHLSDLPRAITERLESGMPRLRDSAGR
jgi:hypothetical protein